MVVVEILVAVAAGSIGMVVVVVYCYIHRLPCN